MPQVRWFYGWDYATLDWGYLLQVQEGTGTPLQWWWLVRDLGGQFVDGGSARSERGAKQAAGLAVTRLLNLRKENPGE